MFGSPGATYRLDAPFRLGLEILINGTAALALYASGKESLTLKFVIIVVFNKLLIIVWEQ